MAKFKKGDRVRYLGGLCNHAVKTGTLCEIDESGNTCPEYHTLEGEEHSCCEPEENFELVTNGDSMKAGDILVDDEGNTRKVLIYLNQGIELYALSDWNEDETDTECIYWFTKAGIEDMGFKLKTDTTVEKSVADLEKELKMQPGTLRIRKD